MLWFKSVRSVTVEQTVLTMDDSLWKLHSNTKEDKRCPLPAKRVNNHTKAEPPDEFQIRKEVKGASWTTPFEHLGHLNPRLHPVRPRAGHGIHEEHEQDTSVNANVPIADGTNSRNVSAVDGRYGVMLWRERLQVPVGGTVRVLEALSGQERE